MRHPHHLPPNVPAAARAPSADAKGVLIRAEPLKRPRSRDSACTGADCGGGCAQRNRATNASRSMSRDQFWYAISIAVLAGTSTGIVLGALRWAADWVGS